LASTSAHADEKRECLAAYDSGQITREQGKLREARSKFEVCGRDTCPGALRKDCVEWFSQVDAAIPTVVIGATDEGGMDLRDVSVTLDGAPLDHALDGRAIPLDPGPHVLRFEAAGREKVSLDVVLREGEKRRAVTAKLPAFGAKKPEPPPIEEKKPIPTTTWFFGGTGAVALGVFAIFGALGTSEMLSLKDGCGKTTSCKQDDVDSAHAKLVVGDVALAVAVIAGGLTAWSLLSR
jgi:hypothetical protein